MKIWIPNDTFKSERTYVINILIGEFLGLQFDLGVHEFPNTRFKLNNNSVLIIEDHFFSKIPSSSNYLSSTLLPTSINSIEKKDNPFLFESDLPILFGTNKLIKGKQKTVCNIDLFASSFFMLTRWEEYVNKSRDQHGRFPGTASIAYKFNFLHRPIVNEYVEMLWNMLTYLGIQQKRKKRNYRAIITHDVDSALLWRNPYIFLKKLGGDLIKRKSWADAKYSIKSYSNYIAGKTKDPYDTFDELMDVSEKKGLVSHFYFLCGGKHKEDNALPLSHPFVKRLMKKIHERGHIIGFHPSFYSYNKADVLKGELSLLQASTSQPILYGRQHFLRFEVPNTWRLWEAAGLKYDSTMYYADAPGFRCGTCYDFPVFDILERKELTLREMPLIAMEVTWQVYKNSSPTEMQEAIKLLSDTCRKYNGDFVLLWHNSSFYGKEAYKLKQVYESVIEYGAPKPSNI